MTKIQKEMAQDRYGSSALTFGGNVTKKNRGGRKISSSSVTTTYDKGTGDIKKFKVRSSKGGTSVNPDGTVFKEQSDGSYRPVSSSKTNTQSTNSYRNVPVKDRKVYDDTGKLVTNQAYQFKSRMASKEGISYTEMDKKISDSLNPFSKQNIQAYKSGKEAKKAEFVRTMRKKLMGKKTHVSKSPLMSEAYKKWRSKGGQHKDEKKKSHSQALSRVITGLESRNKKTNTYSMGF